MRWVAAVVVLTLTACGGSESGSTSRRPETKADQGPGVIRIGVLLPLTGTNAAGGVDMLDAAKLAADDLNAAGGVLGRQIEIVSGDDGCADPMATAAAQNIMRADVVGVAAGYCSGAAIPETVVLDAAGIPFVSAYATNPALTDRGLRTVFRIVGRDDDRGAFAARFLAGPGGVRKLAILHDNTIYAKGLAEYTRAANDALKLGMQIVFFDAVTPGQSDYRPTLAQIKASGADTLYYTGYAVEASVIVRQAKEIAPAIRLAGGDATTEPAFLKGAGAAAEGFVATTAPLPEFLPSAGTFSVAYTGRFGRTASPAAVYEYDAVRVLANAIFWAGSTQPKDIVEALRTTRYQGLTGEIYFDERGERPTSVFGTAVVRDGKFQPHKKLDPQGNWIDG